MVDYKVWIFFSKTGGGHASAARALEAALIELSAQQKLGDRLKLVVDSVVERSHPINQLFVGLYNYLLCHKQSWMKYYYAFINVIKPNDSLVGYWLIRPFLKQLLTKEEPSVIVSVHPMLNHYLARNRKELGLTKTVRLIEVITDPNGELWAGWACKDMDLIIAPNDLARDQLVAMGVHPERIRILGMPVNPDFLKPSSKSRAEFLQELGLEPDKLTVCINAGWAGGGNMQKVYEQLAKVGRPFQVLFLCGHNTVLYEAMEVASAVSPIKTAVLPFHNSMVDVMSHCDLMVTKAGGLTTFEAIAKRLPLVFDVITEPMPQERGTVEMLLNMGVSQAVREPADIISIVESLDPKPNRESQPLPALHNLNQTAGAYEIAKIALAACEPDYDLVVDTEPVAAGEAVFEPLWDAV